MWTYIVLGILAFAAYLYFSHQNEVSKRFTTSNALKYPNFKKALQHYHGNFIKLYADNGRVVTYQMNKVRGNRKVGDIYFILDVFNDVNYLFVGYKAFGKPEVVSTKYPIGTIANKNDPSVELYQEILVKCVSEILAESAFY